VTERLHYDDPTLARFDAEVIEHAELGGKPSAILDRTAFYPESGGQMSDRGTLGGLEILDVQLDDRDRVHHALSGELPPIGSRVEGAIDLLRRREHMALHTGQHALSRALLDGLRAVTVSSRLGESACTIDVDRSGISLEAVRAIEDRVNRLIDEDRPVKQHFPSEAELERLDLRKEPKKTDRIRVVDIEGFDVTPCGGTHCTHTAQIELVFVQGVERYKGGTRVTFAAGPRARRFLSAHTDALRAIAQELKCAPMEASDNVQKLRAKLDLAREDAGAVRARLADLWVDRLRSSERVIAVIEHLDAGLLKSIADRLSESADLVALASPGEGGVDVVIARGKNGALNAGELLKRLASETGGRGGGRPEQAQGRLPSGTDFIALVRSALP
jgi:alanyl-tRNA synthetase